MLVLLPVAGVPGCANDASDESPAVEEVREQRITAETIASLKPGEQLVLDQRAPGKTYTFDFSQAPIDFSRITVINANGNAQPMDKWLSAAKQTGHDLLASPDHTFRLSSSPQGLGNLSETELARLHSTGKVMREAAPGTFSSGDTSAKDWYCEYRYYYLFFCDANGWCYEYVYEEWYCEEREW
ncbi:hypothetical protein D7V93_00655 [Corallococcus llansteffanensis]|uniref:Uncharacterized protein n=2 Tax=Corallococcus llansteffanensis TaxID=2316731 RepID=A0A3A8QM71_9BACT|nr:hypothetical protein D7V93_00655 [Corallococcus llansteffanensis]